MAPNESQIIAFDVLIFLAILLLVLALVPPLFSRHIVRRKTWHSVMLSMLIVSIGEVLLVGHQFEPSPNPNLCLVQVAVIHATPPFVAVAMASYTADIYISIRHMFGSNDWENGPEPENIVFLVLTPWITFFLVFLEAILVIGLSSNGAKPSQLGFYCRTENRVAVIVSVVVVILGGLVAIAYQAATGRLLYRNWIKVQRVSITSTVRKYVYAFVRTLAFTVILTLGIILGVIATFTISRTLFGFTILLPFAPITSALIFGTYKDIMSFYILWR